MAEAQSMVRGRGFARLAAKGAGFVVAGLVGLVVFAACQTPHTFAGFEPEVAPVPRFEIEGERFVTFDGAELGLSVWEAAEATLVDGEPEVVIVGLHGMNDYAHAFHMAAPYWAERGVTTYAYDQRGFGRSAGRGEWPEEEDMREDLRAAVDVARGKHPDAILAVAGISMGGAVTMSAFGSERPPVGVDRVVFSGPGLRGWGSIPMVQQAALWLSARLRPGWDVRPPRFVKIEPSDNIEMLRRIWADPLRLNNNTISQVHGVVSVMESAHDAAADLPAEIPMLLTYGARDIVIPERGLKRTAKVMAPHVRTAYYPEGYHMLLRDLQAERVFDDVLAFLRDPKAELPSGVGEVPGRD